MRVVLAVLIVLFMGMKVSGQVTISGVVASRGGEKIVGANVYLAQTYDGASTDVEGRFSFTTEERGVQKLMVSFIGYDKDSVEMNVLSMRDLEVRLKQNVETMNAVVVTAGTFSAGENSKVKALNSLDVVTTAGSVGNYVAAMKTLPGVSKIEDDGRLFIRGGDGNESQTFIDGVRVFSPYAKTAPGTPVRARYSPMLFKGMTFSTGGYSAEYGQALSGVLLLETKDQPVKTHTNVSVMSVGLGVEHAHKWDRDAVAFSAGYSSLGPYLKIADSRSKWIDAPETVNGEASYRHTCKNGMLKAYVGYSLSDYRVEQSRIDYDVPVDYEQQDGNLYGNVSYKGALGKSWLVSSGVSLSTNRDEMVMNGREMNVDENGAHLKVKLSYMPKSRFRLNMGVEQVVEDSRRELIDPNYDDGLVDDVSKGLTGAFVEANYYVSSSTTFSVGQRMEYSSYGDDWQWMPRLSMAQKVGKYSQVSLAYGRFAQLPSVKYLYGGGGVKPELSEQFIANYQWKNGKRFFRAEAYYKRYDGLLKSDLENGYSNSGDGYARGVDLFWRDDSSFRTFQYWVSYSFIDSERNQYDYPYAVEPNYVTKHNLSVVTKYFIPKIRTQIGLTYSFASGRPYNDPNENVFMNGRTDAFHSVDLGLAWLIRPQTILYCSASNLLGADSVFGYRYGDSVDKSGRYGREPIYADSKRFFFIGLFLSFGSNKNQMDRL